MIDEFEIVDELQKIGVTSARTVHTGGGVHVCEVVLDPTGRDTSKVMWVTTEADYFVIGFYDHGNEEETYEGALVELRAYAGRDPLIQLCEWFDQFAAVTGLVLP